MEGQTKGLVLELKSNLDKALENLASNEEIEDLLVALNKLPVTLELLRSTKIGQTVANVKKQHPEGEIGSLSKEMVANWKKLVPVAPTTTAAPQQATTSSPPQPPLIEHPTSSSSSSSSAATAIPLTHKAKLEKVNCL